MKMKLKVTTVLVVSLFLVSIIAVSTPAKAAEPNRIFMVNFMAKGDDADIPGNDEGSYRGTTLIVGKIQFDKASGVLLGQVEFHTVIYDESGKEIYSIKGKLKDATVMIVPEHYCTVRLVTWTNIWYVFGMGMIKTTDTDLEIVHRGQPIDLPNTKGRYIPYLVVMAVSPNGENLEGEIWEGWAFAGIQGFGGVTWLTKYMEKGS